MTKEEIEYHNKLWYYKTYNQLIDKCIKMESEGYSEEVYTEVHHILPKCMGGTNDKNNLVRVPIKYHITAHLLLARIYPDNVSLVRAALLMITRDGVHYSLRRSTSLRIQYKQAILRSPLKNSTREKMRAAKLGKPLTEEHRHKISMSGKGRVFSEEHKEKIRQANFKNRHIWTKRVQGPDGTIYESLKDCYTSIGKSKKTVMRWVNYRPEKGYKYID